MCILLAKAMKSEDIEDKNDNIFKVWRRSVPIYLLVLYNIISISNFVN